MTNVKPATDEQVADILGDLHQYHDYKMAECPFCAPIRARIAADREEIASVRKAAASKDRLIEQQAAEIAALKAEVERFSRPCHLCFGDGSLYGGRTVSKTECPACHGTGRAR